jgi:hypothetical protein
MNVGELTFEHAAPEWIADSACLRLTGLARGEPVVFLFTAEALCWLAGHDDAAPIGLDAASALDMATRIQSSLIRIAQEEWAVAQGQSRTFHIGWHKTRRHP